MSFRETRLILPEQDSAQLAAIELRTTCDTQEIRALALLARVAMGHLSEAARAAVELACQTVETVAREWGAGREEGSGEPVRLALLACTRDYLAASADLAQGASCQVVQGFEEAQQIISAPLWRKTNP